MSKSRAQTADGSPVRVDAGSEHHDQRRLPERDDRWIGAVSLIGGGLLSGAFYGLVLLSGWEPLQRYFTGHPVAICATILFCIALSILAIKLWLVSGQWQRFRRAEDADLAPRTDDDSPEAQFRSLNDAGYVARRWQRDLSKLPRTMAQSQLVVRLREVLMRQSGRGTTKHLADDLRELSARDADSAHDSFALIRIIVWAIPMLGFLGTVIGITQTLGGLDFSDGQAAVDNLKSGLYVAFDTTALGLVLSIIAIFLQFPVERREQQLLAAIDERVGYLTGLHLPGDEVVDNQYEMLAQLCDGVRAAVAESLTNQTRLWRETIDEAQHTWQQAHQQQSESFVAAIEGCLTPALREHAERLDQASGSNQDRLDAHFDRWQSQLAHWQQSLVAGAGALSRHQQALCEQMETLTGQVDQAALVREQTASVLQLQQTLASNLEWLREANQQLDENLGAAAGQGMADAMIVLARAVDALSTRLAQSRGNLLAAPPAAGQAADQAAGEAASPGTTDSSSDDSDQSDQRRAA